MPPRRTPPAVPVPRVHTRRCRFGGGAGYTGRIVAPDGRVVMDARFAKFGDELVGLDPVEVMRLESLGTLAPEGDSKADVEAEFERRLATYRDARKSVDWVV